MQWDELVGNDGEVDEIDDAGESRDDGEGDDEPEMQNGKGTRIHNYYIIIIIIL